MVVGMVAVLSGCSTTGDVGSASPTGSGTAASPTAASTGATPESRLLTVDDLPADGWVAVPAPTAADSGSGTSSTGDATVDAAAVCQGDFRSILILPPQPATASFQRGEVGFTEQIIPDDDPRGVIDDLRGAVTNCVGIETPLTGQDSTVSFEPLPDSAIDAGAFGAVTKVTAASGVISLGFVVSDLGDAVAFTQLTAPQGQPISVDDLQSLTDTAVAVATS